MWLILLVGVYTASASKAASNHEKLERFLESHHDYWLDGDEELSAEWRGEDMPDGEVNWSSRQRLAVRRALTNRTRWWPLPRVFIYPYPDAFVHDIEELTANVTLKNGSIARSFSSYFQLSYGRSFQQEKLTPRWIPPVYKITSYRDSRNTKNDCESECVGLVSSQHNLPVVVHRGLATSYPNLVESPQDADLFFIPDYFDTTRQYVKLDAYCKLVEPVWKKHLESFRHGATSYAERHGMRDHFVVIGRAWHTKEDEEGYRRRSKVGDCSYHAKWIPHRIQLEVQNPLVRACARAHPVPYASFLFWSNRAGWQASWSETSRTRRNQYLAAAFFNEGETRDSIRKTLKEQCLLDTQCYSPLTNGDGHFNRTGLEAAYRQATFSLQPPGVTAARKGIVDSLLAGTIPVLLRRDDSVSHDQRDMWPWNWPGQGSSSLALTESDIRTVGVFGLLRSIDDEQLDLMQQVLTQQAAGLAWPIDSDIHPSKPTQAERDGEDPQRYPNALELTMRHLGAIARRSIRDDDDSPKEFCTPKK